jgi:hypothetical protein
VLPVLPPPQARSDTTVTRQGTMRADRRRREFCGNLKALLLEEYLAVGRRR